MAKVRDILNNADVSKHVNAEVREALVLLMSLAKAKGRAYEEMIKQDLMMGKVADTLTVPITKIVDSRAEYRAVTKTRPNSTIVDSIKASMAEIFKGDGGILNGISGIVNTALKNIMGEGAGQESEIRSYSVVTEYPAIVRYDFAFWGRNIKSEGIRVHMQNVFTCVAYKSAVDVTKLAFNDFLALYAPVLRAAYANDPTKLKEMIKEAKEVYSLFNVKVDGPTDDTIKTLVHEASMDSLLRTISPPAP